MTDEQQSGLDARVGANPRALLARARDAVRFELALRRSGEPQWEELDAPRAPVAEVDAGSNTSQLPPPVADGAVEKDMVITSFDNGHSKRDAAQPASFGEHLRRLSPDQVDAAIAVGLRDDNDWLG
jgi:hypothetical protein